MSDLQSIDSNPPGSSVHEILQARILEWVAISISREDVSFTKCSSMFVFCATAWVAFLLKLFSCLVAVFYALNSIKTDSWEILAVQWLGLLSSTARGSGSIPGWGAKIPSWQKEKKKTNSVKQVLAGNIKTKSLIQY